MLLDPAYAAGVSADNFDDEVLALHRQVTRPIDARGALQLPWPRALGTPPWAVAHQLSAIDDERTYAARLALRRGRAPSTGWSRPPPPRCSTSAAGGSPATSCSWSSVRRRLAAHLRAEPRPAVRVTRAAFVGATLDLAGWPKPWFTVTPR